MTQLIYMVDKIGNEKTSVLQKVFIMLSKDFLMLKTERNFQLEF